MGVGTFAFRFEAIGTQWEIETREPLGRPVAAAHPRADRRFDTTYSRFRPDSLVARVAAAPDGGRFDFPEDSVALFDLYDRLHAATGGAVDPLVGRDLELLGYDRTYSLTPAPDARPSRGARAGEGDLVEGRHPGRHVARHAASARDRRRGGGEGLPRGHRLGDAPRGWIHPVRGRRERRPPPFG